MSDLRHMHANCTSDCFMLAVTEPVGIGGLSAPWTGVSEVQNLGDHTLTIGGTVILPGASMVIEHSPAGSFRVPESSL